VTFLLFQRSSDVRTLTAASTASFSSISPSSSDLVCCPPPATRLDDGIFTSSDEGLQHSGSTLEVVAEADKEKAEKKEKDNFSKAMEKFVRASEE
jgi:hypothetical protein